VTLCSCEKKKSDISDESTASFFRAEELAKQESSKHILLFNPEDGYDMSF
jgi:hypothetical protein